MFISNSVRGALLGVLAMCALSVAPAANAELRIGVVNLNELAEGSPQYNAMKANLQKDFQARERALVNERKELEARTEKLKKELAVMAESDRLKAERDLRDSAEAHKRKTQDYQQDLNRRMAEESQRINKVLIDEVTAYAKAQNLDLVIGDGVGVLYAKDTINITPALVTALKAKPAAAPAAAKPAEKKP
jgi:outer membrane protein